MRLQKDEQIVEATDFVLRNILGSSPSGLNNGLTYEELMNGHSKIRNRTIANVFNKMGFGELV